MDPLNPYYIMNTLDVNIYGFLFGLDIYGVLLRGNDGLAMILATLDIPHYLACKTYQVVQSARTYLKHLLDRRVCRNLYPLRPFIGDAFRHVRPYIRPRLVNPPFRAGASYNIYIYIYICRL